VKRFIDGKLYGPTFDWFQGNGTGKPHDLHGKIDWFPLEMFPIKPIETWKRFIDGKLYE